MKNFGGRGNCRANVELRTGLTQPAGSKLPECFLLPGMDIRRNDLKNNLIRVALCGLAIMPVAAMAQNVPLVQDSYVIPGNAANFGSASTMNVGGPNAALALAQFDLTALPSGTTSNNIAKATLTLFLNKLGAAGTVNISAANGSWTEISVNGNNAPVAGAAVASAVAASAASEFITVDATAAVQAWLSGTTNSGFIITANDGTVNVAFDTKAEKVRRRAIRRR